MPKGVAKNWLLPYILMRSRNCHCRHGVTPFIFCTDFWKSHGPLWPWPGGGRTPAPATPLLEAKCWRQWLLLTCCFVWFYRLDLALMLCFGCVQCIQNWLLIGFYYRLCVIVTYVIVLFSGQFMPWRCF